MNNCSLSYRRLVYVVGTCLKEANRDEAGGWKGEIADDVTQMLVFGGRVRRCSSESPGDQRGCHDENV